MTVGLALSLVAAGVAVAVHLAIFALESVLFSRPAVRRLFGVRTADDSAPLRLFARNQGVYNLGLALVVAVGVALSLASGGEQSAGIDRGAVGAGVLVAGCAVMVLAAITLAATAPRLWRAALVQGAPPLLAIAALLLL
jgi:putative membrane protein